MAAALPPFVAYVGKLIIDAVIAAHAAAPGLARAAASLARVRLVAVELAAVVLMAGCERVLGLVRQLVGLRLGIDLNVRILEKALRLELRALRGRRVLRQADARAARGLDAARCRSSRATSRWSATA